MSKEVEIKKKIFEQWILHQFDNCHLALLNDFHHTNGYPNEIVNAMWVGFNGGIAISDTIRASIPHE